MTTEEENSYSRGFQHGVEIAVEMAAQDIECSVEFYERLVKFQNGPVSDFRERIGAWANGRTTPPDLRDEAV